MDMGPRIERDELAILAELLPLADQHVIELGCGGARLARDLLARYPDARVTGLEVDAIQHAKNLAAPAERLTFIAAGAEAIPLTQAQFDLALMLKSLHHVPLEAMDQALTETARVLRPGGYLYVSEPVYDGALNEVVRMYNDEGTVRAAAQAALDRALAAPGSPWVEAAQRRFDMPVHFQDFAEFERRMMRPTFADHHITPEILERVAAAFAPHCTAQGAHFVRPMLVRLLQRTG